MSDTFWLTLAANIQALAILLAVLFHRREANKAIAENTTITQQAKTAAVKAEAAVTNGLTTAVEEIHQATNSMKDQLVHATAIAEFARGVLAGKAQAKAEHEQTGQH